MGRAALCGRDPASAHTPEYTCKWHRRRGKRERRHRCCRKRRLRLAARGAPSGAQDAGCLCLAPRRAAHAAQGAAERAHAASSPAESCLCACAEERAEAAERALLESEEAESERTSAKRRAEDERKAAKERRAAERRAEEAARKAAEEAERERVREEQAQVPPPALVGARVCRLSCRCLSPPARGYTCRPGCRARHCAGARACWR